MKGIKETSVKVFLPKQIVRRFRIDGSFSDFCIKMKKFCGISLMDANVHGSSMFRFDYLDNENDWISVSTEKEFLDGLELHTSHGMKIRVKKVWKNHFVGEKKNEKRPFKMKKRIENLGRRLEKMKERKFKGKFYDQEVRILEKQIENLKRKLCDVVKAVVDGKPVDLSGFKKVQKEIQVERIKLKLQKKKTRIERIQEKKNFKIHRNQLKKFVGRRFTPKRMKRNARKAKNIDNLVRRKKKLEKQSQRLAKKLEKLENDAFTKHPSPEVASIKG